MADITSLEARYHQRLLDLYRETGVRSTAMGKPYWASRFLQMVKRRGGLGATRVYLARPDPQPGFNRMIQLGLPQLSLEAAVLEEPFRPLFTPQELATARRRLEAEGVRLPD